MESEVDKSVLCSSEKSVGRDLIRLIHTKSPDPGGDSRDASDASSGDEGGERDR
jgi:hypothetical protein